MLDVFDRCRLHDDVQPVTEMGAYPYYHPAEERLADGRVRVHGRVLVSVGSNDYLGLSADPRLKDAACRAVRSLGTGTSGSRMANGSLTLHETLEGRLATFLGQESAMVTPTGFLANLVLSALVGPRDTVLADQLIHASLIDAVRLARARLRRYRHNDLDRLEHLLRECDPAGGALILTEGMFSTTGTLCDLPGTAALARRHGVRLILDGAHDIGLIGPGGRGAAEHYGLGSAVDLHTLAFSKCFGTTGGAVAGPEQIILYLRHQARSMVYSAALSPASTAAALAALDIIEHEPERRHRALAAAARLRADLTGLGYETGDSPTTIIPVHVGDLVLCCRLWRELFDEGVFTTAMVPPAVPDGQALIRVSTTALHTDPQLDQVAAAFAAAGRRLGLIP
ncbi:pyridoxal phosphate-dependent aminotransferase family protein [Nonomuraea sp. FMUSA5-5]|uniref:8-amino-7-oxononanoate synthase n=1 Tax=Nonomuraea composti TaxID=2720023 RepID=A0ABM7MGL4_9ACTN|nr:pyridoxal phosphate-dependent aminotransferase family protein [Nonomuraea sp. FMUSA5-5]NJP96755.1 pyridoxal phosphate-dependent aminotransferase family protein [Nonomuraea sp. FMUSA5-5]